MCTKKMIQNALKSTCLSSLRLSAVQKPTSCIDSKFGGIFYLPEGENIPSCPEGEPMQFLAQINFTQMPHLEGFPRAGLLQFFLDTNQEHIEEKIDDPNTRRQLYSVRYYSSPNAALQQAVEPQQFTPTKVITTVIPGHMDLPWLEGKIAFRSDTEVATVYVGMEDIVSDLGYETICKQQVTPKLVQQSGYDLENNESALDDLCWNLGNWGTKLGGHPAIHQADSRLDFEDDKNYTSLLFQYDFTTKKELEADTFQFFVKPQDLENACFDDVLFCWHNAF